MDALKGQLAIITGGAGGIGFSMAKALSAEGMRLVLADIDETRLNQCSQVLKSQGADVAGWVCDVRDTRSVEALRDAVVEQIGHPYLVCLNAGGAIPASAKAIDVEELDRVLDLNLYGVVNGVRAFLPLLEVRGGGHISVTASTRGLTPTPPMATYNTAKAAVLAYMQTLAYELIGSASPVSVSVLCPGTVATRFLDHAVDLARGEGHEPSSDAVEAISKGQEGVLEHGIDPDEVARTFVDGIKQGRFWIFTHPDWVSGPLSDRFRAMVEDGSLPEL